MDGFCIRALLLEARTRLAGATISRVTQPDRWSLLLSFRGDGGSGGLLLSVKPGAPGVGLLSAPRDLPHRPSRFGEQVASQIKGATIEAVEQVGLERIVAVHLRGGVPPEAAMTIYAEMLGPRGNIILVDRDAGTVIDRLRSHSGAAPESPQAGEPYRPPFDDSRADPGSVTEEEFDRRVRLRLVEGMEPARALMSCLTGFSPLMAKELVARSGLSPVVSPDEQARSLWKPFCDLMAGITQGRVEPRLLVGPDGRPVGIAAVPLISVPAGRQVPCATMSEATAAYLGGGRLGAGLEASRAGLLRRLKGEVARAERLSARLAEEVALYRDADLYGRKGQLLLANRAAIRRGERLVQLPDHADPETGVLEIELDPSRSIEENAKRYFSLQRKAKRGEALVGGRLAGAAMRLSSLRELIREAETATSLEALERVESALAPLVRRPAARDRASSESRKSEGPEPRSFRSSDGLSILVGKSGPGNDYLTWRLARSHDLWLHAQGVPGSHVLVRLEKGKPPPPRTLLEAAQIAAYYSRARGGTKVPVDYALKKYLRKPKAAAPGMVLLTQEKTIVVRPDREVIRRLHPGQSDSRTEG